MQDTFRLFCLWLVTGFAIGHSVETTTQSLCGNQQLMEELRKVKNTCKNDVAVLVAQQAQQLLAMKDKLHSLESSLATKTELQAAQSQLKAELDTKVGLGSHISQGQGRENLGQRYSTGEGKRRTMKQSLTVINVEGSSFIRWGRKSCPVDTTLVYAGVAGGKQYKQKGSGTNRLCLTRTPQFDNTARPAAYGYLYGAEYENIPGHHNHNVPCSVCLAPQSTTIMVPATLTCPPGWTPQYTGHLASQYKDHYATEYVCLDGSPEDDSSDMRHDNGLLFYYVVTVCGSLPCPPYINDKVVTCVVCSK